jgi:hypothetical protein
VIARTAERALLLDHYRLGRKVRPAVWRAVVIERDNDEASEAAVWQLARCEPLDRPRPQLSARVQGDDALTLCCWLHGATLQHDAPAVKGLVPLLGSDMTKQRRPSLGTRARLRCPDTSSDASDVVAGAYVHTKRTGQPSSPQLLRHQTGHDTDRWVPPAPGSRVEAATGRGARHRVRGRLLRAGREWKR